MQGTSVSTSAAKNSLIRLLYLGDFNALLYGMVSFSTIVAAYWTLRSLLPLAASAVKAGDRKVLFGFYGFH
jgi:hypothetical protein